MRAAVSTKPRQTSADIAFDYLQDEILSLRLLPGAKISESEIAARLGLSRQPVREAFGRLDSENLLVIRPQKVTTVRKFSLKRISSARFTRLAVELEVLREAVRRWDNSLLAEFNANLEAQNKAQEDSDLDRFHQLDFEFHRLICKAADKEFAFQTIAEKKTQIARLCVLSLTAADEMAELISDHRQLVDRLKMRDEDGAVTAIRLHLSRLDETVQSIYNDHASYFEDD